MEKWANFRIEPTNHKLFQSTGSISDFMESAHPPERALSHPHLLRSSWGSCKKTEPKWEETKQERIDCPKATPVLAGSGNSAPV